MRPSSDKGFDARVWHAVSLIPHGHLATYGQVADWIGAWGCARQVGWALRRRCECQGTDFDVPQSRGLGLDAAPAFDCGGHPCGCRRPAPVAAISLEAGPRGASSRDPSIRHCP